MIKFSCEKVFLQNAIAVTSRAVAQKSSIPALEGLLLHADQQLTISGYNMQTGIRTNVFANVVEGGDIVLNARLFGDIIRRMPDDMITFTADEKMMVHVSCGDADFDILGLSAADYPDLPEVEDGIPAGEAGKAGGRRVFLRLPRLRSQRGQEHLRRHGGSGDHHAGQAAHPL